VSSPEFKSQYHKKEKRERERERERGKLSLDNYFPAKVKKIFKGILTTPAQTI
jgi:hypothetical protein